MLNIIKNEIKIGLKEPLKILHITDSHLTFVGEENHGNETRWKCFESPDNRGSALKYYLEALKYAEDNNLLIVNTGDLIDFLSVGNFEFLDKYSYNLDCVYAAGNHDFCHCVGKAKEDRAYKWEMMKRVAPHFKQNLYFDSKIVNGVNFVSLDNSYYLIEEGQIQMLKAEVSKGLPIVLCMHTLLYEKNLAEREMSINPCAYVVAAPEELLKTYPLDRRLQQTPDEATLRAVEYIKIEPTIKLLITGHTHYNYDVTLDSGLRQITTDGSYNGVVREITLY